MRKLICLFTVLSVVIYLNGQPVLVFTPVVNTGLSGPVDIVNAGDGTNRMFVVQQGGVIRVYDAAWNLLNSNFLTINTNFSSGGERGLLSLVFHPEFELNRYFFVYYTNSAGGINIDRFQTQAGNPNAADAATRTNIMTIPKPVTFTNHNGGKLNFGPDGHLYFGLGDGGSGGDPRNYAQRGDSLWGKMVRINVDNFTTPPFYTVPADNPYVGNPLYLAEIYNTGLRNPWRWSFDRLNGNMWIADVGQNVREEVHYRATAQTNGANYGWRCYEGNAAYNTTGCLPASNYIFPVFDYPHNNTTGGFSITGGYVYRGSLYPALYGWYICADYVSRNGWVINTNTFASSRQAGLPASLTGFGETEAGELFAVSQGNIIYSVTTSSVVPLQLLNFEGYRSGSNAVLTWETARESQVSHFTVQHSSDGAQFTDAGRVTAQNLPAAVYRFDHSMGAGTVFYRLQIQHRNGDVTYSKIIALRSQPAQDFSFVRYHSGNPRMIWITGDNGTLFRLYTSNGQLVQEKRLSGNNSTLLHLEGLASGMYMAELTGSGQKRMEKVMLR